MRVHEVDVDYVFEQVHVEGLAMFEHVFRSARALRLRAEGWDVPVGGGVGDPAEDQFALTERGQSAVWWTRGRAESAVFTGIKPRDGEPAVRLAFPCCEQYLGVKVVPGERVPPHLAPRLAALEEPRRSRLWHGGAFRSYKREVYHRTVRTEVPA